MKPIIKTSVTASILSTLLLTLPVLANNIRVENVDIRSQNTQEQTMLVEFDLGWENSWRNELNHDAAWVFVKFRAPGSNHWQHAYLSVDNADHSAPGGRVEVGTSSLGATTNAVGAFIFSANNQTGIVAYARARLTWDYGASGYAWSAGEEIDVSVHAIEMVYVAEGSFYVGSGGTESGSFTEGGWESGATIPFLIDSEAALAIGPETGKLWGTVATGNNGIGGAGTLPAAFPKGYGAFYSMKYLITQGQYVEFLNLLSYGQQKNRVDGSPDAAVGTYSHATERHALHIAVSGASPDTPAVYATDNPYVACNYLSWMDGAAYAQWTGLRLMTELEFEKACRGPAQPVPNEYAWGTASIFSTGGAANYSDLGEATEIVSQGNAIYTGSSPGGPVRVGIFATAASTREEAGASYWGIMELSGNLYERSASAGHATSRLFEGTHGDGTLNAAGHATRPDWPGYSGGAVTGAGGAGFRGGAWSYAIAYASASDRNRAAGVYALRYDSSGGRAVRTVPSGVGP